MLHALVEGTTGGHRDPLVGQRGAGQRPAAVDLPDHHLVGHEHVIEEHLVEEVVAGDLTQRPDVDALRAHVDQEVRDALVFWSVWVRPGETHAPLGPVRPRRPYLLPGEKPTRLSIAPRVRTFSTNGFHPQRGKIGTCARLTEQLAPEHLAGQRGR